MQAVHSAVQAVAVGDARVVLAGGVESMSTAPYYLRAARFGYSAGNGEIVDPNTESQPRSQPIARYGHLTMGMTAENLAVKYGIARHRQDEFALKSQEKTAAAIAGGAFHDEIAPVTLPGKRDVKVFSVDEHPRATSLEELGKLRPAFKENGTVTAGNSSGRNDGAAALLVASGESAQALGIRPMARVVAQAAVGVAPDYMGIGPAPAIRLALKRAGLNLKDIGLFEINEAFAAQTLAVVDELGLDTANLNVNGGAIALGHPIGCSGARILVTLLHEMAKRQIRYGCAALCIAGGMGIATVVERL
jgi:acetyl-CoA C-acetyltransferase